MMFHIVNTDNFGGDYPDESLTAKEIRDRKTAETLADALNHVNCSDYGGPRFFKVVEDGYKLQSRFEP